MPAAMQSVIAGSPSRVPGILIIAFGRSSERHSRSASWTVAEVSWASVGETSSETSPSPPPDARYTPANASQADRTSATARCSNTSCALRPDSVSSRISSSYSRLPAIAFSKIVGFEVMPRRPSPVISRPSSPVVIRSRVM